MFTSTTQKKGNSVMAETAKNVNYSDEMTTKVIEDYQNGIDLDVIADTVGKTVRSVRSKLVREGVYTAKPKTPSAKKEGPTKKELLIALEGVAPFEVIGFMGATKAALTDLITHFELKQ